MASSIHSLLPRIAIGLTVPLIALGIIAYQRLNRAYVPPAGSDVFALAEGRWAWTNNEHGCASDWHRISFSADRRLMTITSSEPYEVNGKPDSVAIYDISTHTQSAIRGAIRGETRLTLDGKPVVWDLVLRSSNRYAWHRTDWVGGALTREIQRCPDSL